VSLTYNIFWLHPLLILQGNSPISLVVL